MKILRTTLFIGFTTLSLSQEPALAHRKYFQAGTCYKNKYIETYHPGTRESPGYVTSRDEVVEQRCPRNLHFHGKKSHKHKKGYFAHDHHSHALKSENTAVVIPSNDDNNSCLEGTIAGGVLGGALGGALAKKDNWIWSIPVGAVGGALVGCQVDGG